MSNEKKESLLKFASAYRYKDDDSVINDDNVLTIGGKKTGSLGNFVILSGKQKSRKTAVLGAIMGSALTGDPIFEILCDLPKGHTEVLHVDTEQARYDHAMSMDRMKRSAKLKKLPRQFHPYRMRDWSYPEIKLFIEQFLQSNTQVGLVVIDGVIDLCSDFNDTKSSKELSDWLKMITEKYNVLIIGVMHRGKNNGFSLGHLGSYLERFAQSQLEVSLGSFGESGEKVNKNISTIRAEFMRSDREFDPISITYDQGKGTWRHFTLGD